MAKQGYKLQDFVAHSSNVNCLKIGRKSCRVLATGGEDHKVNLWAIGKPISILRLSGHTSPVESVTFDSAEVLVVAGASSGKIKLWDLEEAKIVQTFTGHRSNCISVDFHPFGELFASGSLDTGLKIWDIRRKGSIHTYKGHTRGVSSVRFTPDGRWVVSGGEDNTVKLWDLTAGKLLHNFKCHEGRIRCIDFHPQEYLLATGSADRTVKFWDLETFELIGSTGPEATGVCSMIFNADGRTLFCGLHESLKVFSWEPMRCHDAVDVGWSGLADFNICEGKLLGCSSNQSCVGIWVVDISRIGPYAVGSMSRENGHRELKFNPGENQSLHQLGSSLKVNMTLLTPSQDSEIKEKKSSLCVNSACNSMTLKKNSMENVQGVPNIQVSRLGVGATMVPGNSPTVKPAINSTKETSTAKRMPPGMILSKPTHVRKPSNIGVCTEEQYLAIQSVSLSYKSNDLGNEVDRNLVSRFMAKDDITVAVEGSRTNIRNVAENFEKNMIHEPPLSYHRENYDAKVLNCRTGPSTIEPIKVEPGRTRSLVESWERRERCSGNEMPATGTSSDIMSGMHTSPYISKGHLPTAKRDITSPDDEAVAENIMQYHDFFRSVLQSRLRKLQIVRQFWEQNDVKGAINAMGKLSDHSIQVDVISVLMENIDIVKLGHCAWLLPVLTSLLDSKIDRHVGIALEMLLKLERIFRPLISSTLSASSPIGVDLQAEQRMDLCKECFIHLQKAKEPLPLLIKKGGLIAKSAQDLSQALQDS